MSCLTEALHYAERGWHVLPLHAPEGNGCSCGKPHCSPIGKHPRTKDGLANATSDAATIVGWWRKWPVANVGIRTGECSGLAVLDVDGEKGKASLQELQATHGVIMPTLRAWTGRASADGQRKGCHYFFKMPEGMALRNSAGVLGKGLDIRAEGGYVVAAPSKHHSGLLYQWLKKEVPLAEMPAWMLAALVKPKRGLESKRLPLDSPQPEESVFPEGRRNDGLVRLAGVLRNKGLSIGEMTGALLAANQERCELPLPEGEVQGIARSVGRYPPQGATEGSGKALKAARKWPSPLGDAAFHGLAGEFVRLVEPQTEADPAALLFQLLTALGSIIGRGPHYRVGSEHHGMNLFMVCVVESSKGRKGTSWNEVKAFCKLVDIGWFQTRMANGLSTGEGLIHAVRDSVTERVQLKDKGRVVDTQEQTTDFGVDDKRLLCMESEFSQSLQCASRDGNTLSPIVRQAWDGSQLRVLTKGAKGECAEPHISIIGHITNTELQTLLTANDAANGFANRFIWVGVKRSKALPFGGTVDKERLEELALRTRDAITQARLISEIGWADDGAEIWTRVYEELSNGGHGLLGSVTARAESQVVRIACLYALLESTDLIGSAHIRAALELWRYSAESAAFIFGGSLGDPTCDSIVELLRSKPEGVKRVEITEHFNRNKTKAQLDAALDILQAKKMIYSSKRETGGRAAEVWQLVSI